VGLWEPRPFPGMEADVADENEAARTRNCRCCGRRFIPSRPWAVFCSPACRYTHYNRNTRILDRTKLAFLMLAPIGLLIAKAVQGVLL